jgi:hypothetical protein
MIAPVEFGAAFKTFGPKSIDRGREQDTRVQKAAECLFAEPRRALIK